MNKKLSPELRRILEAGNAAPSGENCQPWHFIVRENAIEVHLLPERDQSAYGWGQRGSYFANGAAIENIVIAASVEHYRTEVQYLPNPQDEWHTATITLTKDSSVIPDSLAEHIHTRISNRKPYQKTPLTAQERSALVGAINEPTNFVLKEDPIELEHLGRVGSTNEEIMLANRALHNFFFSHVTWTKEEDEKNKIGFYIKTLELPPPAQAMFKVFKHWSIMRVLSALGFSRVIAKQNGVTNASASAIGALMIDDTSPQSFLRAGRMVERVWLTATSLGLSFQPLTGVLFFKLKIEAGDADHTFSAREEDTIMSAYAKAVEILGAGQKHISFMFRVGHGDAPSAHAIRFPLEEAVTIV